jgi:hypothetical protein
MNIPVEVIVVSAFMAIIFVLYRLGEPKEDKPKPPATFVDQEQLAKLGAPSLVLTATSEPGFSKIGGAPQLTADLTWPIGEDGPRTFLAQLDLAEVKRWGGPEWLPALGRIYAFADEVRAGFADHVVILASSLEPQAPLGSKSPRAISERRVEGRSYTSFPSPEWLGVDGVEGEQEGLDEFVIEPEAVGREGMHRIGGFPSEIQGGRMNVECEYLSRGLDFSYKEPIPDETEEAAKSWRLLLQIDSDRDLKMNWWDGGRFYIFIREEDARAGDFSKTVTLSQTY